MPSFTIYPSWHDMPRRIGSMTIHDGYRYPGGAQDVVDLASNVSAATREALRLPDRITKEQLVQTIVGLKAWPDERFPRGKWACLAHLECLLLD